MGRNRKKERIKEKLMVTIRWDKDLSEEIMGITANISENGMCIITDKLLPEYEIITVLVAAEGDIFSLTGEPIWTNTYSDTVISTGISFNSSPLNYIDFVNKKNYH